MRNPVQPNEVTLASARAIYAQNCAKCHGVDGDGKRPPRSMFFYSVPPTNFTDAKLMNAVTDGELFWKISEGRRPMPGFKNRLTIVERWELVNLLRTLAHPAGTPAAQPSSPNH